MLPSNALVPYFNDKLQFALGTSQEFNGSIAISLEIQFPKPYPIYVVSPES